jgi:hypothetical protein
VRIGVDDGVINLILDGMGLTHASGGHRLD